jgi:hypothetical protein
MLAAAILFLASAAADETALPIKEGGFCAGISWISVDQPVGYSIERGPDFVVFRYDGPNSVWWGAYSGRYAQVSGSSGATLFKSNGVTVRSAIVEGKFRGYLALGKDGRQNHFFGSIFKNDKTDMGFFSRVEFGKSAEEKCKRYWQP